MDNQQAQRLLALWKSGRDKYASFFTVLEEVRAEVGNEALPRWCALNLQIGLSVIVKIRNLLRDTDAAIVKANFTAAEAINKAQAEQNRHETALKREAQKQARLKEILALKLGTEQLKQEVEKAKGETKKARERNRGSRKRNAATLTAEISSIELDDLIKRFKAAEALCQHGLGEWVEGSIAKAIILAAARAKFTADQLFGAWCDTNSIEIDKSDRAALINLGRLGEAKLRDLFNNTQSRSYQLIWRQHNKPDLKLIDASVS